MGTMYQEMRRMIPRGDQIEIVQLEEAIVDREMRGMRIWIDLQMLKTEAMAVEMTGIMEETRGQTAVIGMTGLTEEAIGIPVQTEEMTGMAGLTWETGETTDQ